MLRVRVLGVGIGPTGGSGEVFIDGEIQKGQRRNYDSCRSRIDVIGAVGDRHRRHVARRAYDLVPGARGGEHGHDVDDWMKAERELQRPSSPPRRDAAM
jgi:Protein of unknown function (DUF2934)